MKFRVRYERKTSLLVLSDDDGLTIGDVKRKISETLWEELHIPSTFNFDISLDGKCSLGVDRLQVSSAGIVSGDLLKLIPSQDRETTTLSPVISEISIGVNSVAMSTVDNDEPSTSSAIANSSTEDMVTESSEDVPQAIMTWRNPPLSLQDYKENDPLPSIMQQMYMSNQVQSDFHATCIALHYLMLESGFTLQNPSSGFEGALQASVVSVDYSHPSAEALLFSMTCNPLGQFVLINGIVKPCLNTEEQVLSLQVKTSEFVKRFNSTSKPQDDQQVYKNLSKLSYIFKENIAHKAIDTMREELQLPPLHGILSLFPDLLKRIVSQLGFKDLCALSQTCSALANIANDDDLWKVLYLRDFKTAPVNPTSRPLKEVYKQSYVRKQEQARQRLHHEREILYFEPPYAPMGTPVPDMPEPFPGQPPGIIGGDYDLDPTFPYGPFANPGRRPQPIRPIRPGLPGSGNPLPGSRFDPINPHGGRFRPGRGGGMMDDDFGMMSRQRRRPPRGGFGGFGGGGFM